MALKNCVKLPSADAESDAPGVEKPFIRDGLAAGGGVSIAVLAGGSAAGAAAFTKIRVNSPGPGLAPGGGFCGATGAEEAGVACKARAGAGGGAGF